MDEIVWAVNPRHDTLDSLASYLSRFAQDFLSAADIRCRLELPLQLPALPLRAEVRHNLFLAFKEALHNTVKHAAASKVRIGLSMEPARLIVSIEDDGRGLDADGEHDPTSNPGPGRFRRRSFQHAPAFGRNRRPMRGQQCSGQRHESRFHHSD